MASVFLSYDREDADRARPIALALKKAGHSVWWDLHVRGGAQFSKVIEEALKAADAVVVLWSKQSVESAWVRDEAAAGRDSGRLIPVSIDGTEPPMGFRQYQTLDLSAGKGRLRSAQIKELLGALAGLSGSEAPAPTTRQIMSPVSAPRNRWVVAVMLAGVLLASLYAGWRYFKPSSAVPTIAVAAADGSESSMALARDLLVKLGSLQAAEAGTMRLIEQDGRGAKANLIFEASDSSQGRQSESSLALFSGKDRSLLWSKHFRQPSGNSADLKQQVAYTAAFVLDCALEGLSTAGKRLSQPTLKLYLNGCAASADVDHGAFFDLADVFREVTSKAPDFEGGWAKLLLVESAIIDVPDFRDETGAVRQALRAHIDAARRLNPKLAEADLAEASLMPPDAIERRIRLVERAVANNPRNAVAASSHSTYLQQVGRMRDAVRQAQRAVQLAPLAPEARDTLIGALTYSGNLESALRELEKAEHLWPGASNLADARYRLHLRYGDPREALRMQPSRKDEAEANVRKAFLQARLAPTRANVERAIAGPRHWFRQYPEAIAELAQVLGEFGKEEELFPILLTWRHRDKVNYITDVLFRPALRNVHRDPRMIAVAKRLGLLDYWRKSGKWPDFCSDPELPYDCAAEAAKYSKSG